MDNSTSSGPQAPSANSYNWILLIELLICSALVIFFLAYFNRLFATIISYVIRWYTWRTYNAYIDIQALQISLLGGRIFFKGVRYHGHNVTLVVNSGFVTWRYWFRRARKAQVFVDDGSSEATKPPEDDSADGHSPSPERGAATELKTQNLGLPCRLTIRADGIECFVYNRSPAYDNILKHFTDVAAQKDGASEKDSPERSSSDSREGNVDKSTALASKASLPFFLRLFPIEVDARTGAVVLGNETTRSIITVKFASALGVFDAGKSGQLDVYKQIFAFDIIQPVLSLRSNLDYKEPLLMAGARKLQSKQDAEKPKTPIRDPRTWFKLPRLFNSANSIKTINSTSDLHDRTSVYTAVIPGFVRWQGLRRYMDENSRNEHEEWENVEYARSTTLADCPRIGFTFYWDVPGLVPKKSEASEKEKSRVDHVNGSNPPAYGMDILVYGGHVSYGPWMDRERIVFQNLFFPPIYADAIPGTRLKPGEYRISSEFKLYLSIEESTILRIPIRESSKDWKWKGKADALTGRRPQGPKSQGKGRRKPFWRHQNTAQAGANARPFAWLDVKVSKDTTINYVADMIARDSGFQSKVDGDIRGIEISSSVNHGLLWRSGPTTLDCDLSVPLGYNTLRNWRFAVKNHDLELFVLRDHLFLVMDIISDWTSGPAGDMLTFTPFRYHLDVEFHNFKLYLNTNDSNIINNPSEPDDNHFFILHGKRLEGSVCIPLDECNPKTKEIPFDITGYDFGLQLKLNTRNTVATFFGDKDVALLDELKITGSHVANSESSKSVTDRLTFNIHGSRPTMWMFGFVLQRLITLKENYFGDHLHFKTLEEYQNLARAGALHVDDNVKAQISNRSSDLDVILCITVADARIMLPTKLYKNEENIGIDLPYAGVDLRITNYYMDLQVDLSPITLSLHSIESTKESMRALESPTEIFVQSTYVAGHRIFGLPPKEPSYVSQFNIEVGNIYGQCSELFVEKLFRSLHALASTIEDQENTLQLIPLPKIHDVSFIQASVKEVNIGIQIEHHMAMLVKAAGISVNFHDFAGRNFSQQLDANVAEVSVSVVDAMSATRRKSQQGFLSKAETHAHFRTSVNLNLFRRSLKFSEERQKQQDFLTLHDSRTHRAPFLVDFPSDDVMDDDPPALQYPLFPVPINSETKWKPRKSGTVPVPDDQSESTQASVHRDASKRPSLRRLRSDNSISASIRSIRKGTRRRSATPGGNRVLDTPKEEAGKPTRKQWLGKISSVALSSPLATPHFALLNAELDTDHLPPLPRYAQSEARMASVDTVHLPEDSVRTSISVTTGSGIQGFIDPFAIYSVVHIVGLLQPKMPTDVLDLFQSQVSSKLNAEAKTDSKPAETLELRLSIPMLAVRVLIPFDADSPDVPPGLDQFDLSWTGFSLLARLNIPNSDPVVAKAIYLHTVFDSLGLVATEKCPAHDRNDVALAFSITDFLLWAASSQKRTVNTSFKTVDGQLTSIKVEYLLAMARRTIYLAEDLAKKILALQDSDRDRLAYLAYALTIAGEGIRDPPFLTRPSYLIRGSPNHLRSHDSWKIVSRFRHIYESMDRKAKAELDKLCFDHTGLIPDRAEKIVLDIWTQWRSWDLTDVQSSVAMRQIYQRLPVITKERILAKQTQFRIRAGSINIAIDPGPNKSDLVIQNLAVDLTHSPPLSPSGLMLLAGNSEEPTQFSLLQASSSGVFVGLHWDLLGLAETIIKIIPEMRDLASRMIPPDSVHPNPELTSPVNSGHMLQAVLTVTQSVVTGNTRNVQAVLANNQMSASVLGRISAKSGEPQMISALLHATEAWTEIKSKNRTLLTARAESPNLYLSREAPSKAAAKTEVEWRLAATSSNLSIDIDHVILDMIEVADQVILDELMDLKQRFQNILGPSEHRRPAEEYFDQGLPKLNLALLMDSYAINVALLQSIAYTMSGKQGRISVIPRLKPVSLDLNFDLYGHQHNLISTFPGEEHIISTFELPPINGQVGIRKAKGRTILEVNAIIDEIVIEASAVNGLLATFKRPEVSKTFDTIQNDIATVQEHLERALPSSVATTLKEDGPKIVLVYRIQATVAGVRIMADATTKVAGDSTASRGALLSLGMDSVQVNAFNVLEDEGDIMLLPEVVAKTRQIYIKMNIQDEKGTRPCGELNLAASFQMTKRDSKRGHKRNYKVALSAIHINIIAETASAVVDVLNHLQDKIKDLDLSRERRYLQSLRQPTRRPSGILLTDSMYSDASMEASGIFTSAFSVSLSDIQVAWIVGNSVPGYKGVETQDLVLSIKMIDLRSRSRSTSRLTIEGLLLQMTPMSQTKRARSLNSALLPEVIFNVAYASSDTDRRIGFHAKGKALDVHFESMFLLPADVLQRSITVAVDKFKAASETWEMTPTASGTQRRNPFGDKRLSSLLVDADFAGAIVRLNGRQVDNSTNRLSSRFDDPKSGRYGQFLGDSDSAAATFQTPGIAFKVEYTDTGTDSSLTSEIKISGSSNSLSPTVVPLILDISNSVKTIVEATDKAPEKSEKTNMAQSFFSDERLLNADPGALLGSTSFNLGIRIRRQEFSLGCQPIARVDATVGVEDIYITANSIKSTEHDLFFAVGVSFEKLQASVQHMYSRDSTFSFDMERLVLSVMNSKHLSGTAGLSAVLKIYPTKTHVNARQLQDFLLFRDIWLPEEIRQSAPAAVEPQDYSIQRYQQVANATAFPWTAAVSVPSIEVELDMGQAVGKASLNITNMWANSSKDSNWEQNLCWGIESIAIKSTGRTSGFVELDDFQLRTSISWPVEKIRVHHTPLIQASTKFDRLRVKAAFDYQAFGVADISNFTFLMYNVRENGAVPADRLVASLDGDKVQVSATATSAAQGLALYQAIERLIQENQAAYAQSLKDIERYLRRHSSITTKAQPDATPFSSPTKKKTKEELDNPFTLHTDVVVTLRTINVGAFPNAFSDNRVFLLNANDIQARFAVKMDNGQIHSGLGMTLGQLQVALTHTAQETGPKTLDEITVEDVVNTLESARGGIILRVPKVVARMQTWQRPRTYHIDYVFHSSFEGKVDVGWNYSRISFIRDMWSTHSQSLASRLGKPMPESAVKIMTARNEESGEQTAAADGTGAGIEISALDGGGKVEKITAVVNVGQGRYDYTALEEAVIEAPQLRDMGEATPPLEWIGLHRDRLPNVTHQIVIVGLLGVAREVEDAYGRILGNSEKS